MSDQQIHPKIMSHFRANNGRLRMSDALARGINRYTLYSLLEKGLIEQVSRGIYQLADLPCSNPDLVTVALRVKNAVICLVSALAYHELTTQVPHKISIALPRTSRYPTLDYPPLELHKFSDQSYLAGINIYQIDNVDIKIYNPEKTLVDCFKFRNKIGMDIVLEALKLYKLRMKFNQEEIIKYAKICRVEKVVRPYLEAII